MGFYDERCMVTGVSLKGADAALVLLDRDGDEYHPIALAIKGAYNRLGSIDNIDEDENTELVLGYFREKLRGGELVIDAAEADGEQINDIEHFLGLCERNVTVEADAAVLSGRRVAFALIAQVVWDAIAKSAPAGARSDSARFKHLFPAGGVAEGIYREHPEDVSTHLKELAGVAKFLADRGIGWKPPDDHSQHYSDEMREYLAAARQTFHDSPVVLGALNRYASEVRDLLDDE
jgi:hypothetical protein